MMENIKAEILHQGFQVLKKKVEWIKLCRPLGQAFGGYSSKAAASFVRKGFRHDCFCKSNDDQYNNIIRCSMVAHNQSNIFHT